MDLGTAPLFDLTAPAAEAGEPVAVSRSEELLAEIRDRRAVIAEQEIATLRAIAEWAGEHVVADEADAATITERGLDTGLPVAGPGAPLISDFAVMELSALLGRSLDSGRNYVGQVVELAHRLPQTLGPGPGRAGAGVESTADRRLHPPPARRRRGVRGPAARPLRPRLHLGPGRPARRGSPGPIRPRSRRGTPPGGPGAPPRRPRPGPGRLRRHRPRHHRPRRRRRPRPRTSHRPPRQAQRPARRHDSLDVRRAKALGEIAREDLSLDLRGRRPRDRGDHPHHPRPQDRAHPPHRPPPTRPSAGSATPAPRSRWSRSRPGSTCPTPA